MIEEQAKVVAIEGDMLILQAQTQTACGNCSASKGCGTSLLSKVIGRKFTEFQVHNSVNAAVGDDVVVGIAEDALLKGSMVIYLVPIVAMFSLALLADHLLPLLTDSRDLMVAASAIIGFAAGAFVAKSYFQRQSSMQFFSPVILRKIIGHGKL